MINDIVYGFVVLAATFFLPFFLFTVAFSLLSGAGAAGGFLKGLAKMTGSAVKLVGKLSGALADAAFDALPRRYAALRPLLRKTLAFALQAAVILLVLWSVGRSR